MLFTAPPSSYLETTRNTLLTPVVSGGPSMPQWQWIHHGPVDPHGQAPGLLLFVMSSCVSPAVAHARYAVCHFLKSKYVILQPIAAGLAQNQACFEPLHCTMQKLIEACD